MSRIVALLSLPLLAAVLACRPAVPPPIRDELVATPPGKATVVFFTDFECPFCKRTHAALAPLLAERKGQVRLVVRHVPLLRHPDARAAARAAVCVEGLSPDPLPFFHALSASYDLSEHSSTELAIAHGVDADRFERCLRDPATERRLDDDLARFEAVGGDGVPLLFVGTTRLEGAQTRATLAAALDDAIAAEK